jgi:8-oxo-dGTP diphosphatase
MYTYDYPRPALTADAVVFAYQQEKLYVLLIQRGQAPFKGKWAFPGGFMDMDETTRECAIRELGEETGLVISDLEEVGAFSKVDRDPRGRVVTVAYYTLLNNKLPELKAASDVHTFSGFRSMNCREWLSIIRKSSRILVIP